MGRAIINDVTLVPVIFIIMSVFCVIVFFRRDRVHSRSLLGFCGVVAILLSLSTGYGLMFVCGVPLTAMTQVRGRYRSIDIYVTVHSPLVRINFVYISSCPSSSLVSALMIFLF